MAFSTREKLFPETIPLHGLGGILPLALLEAHKLCSGSVLALVHVAEPQLSQRYWLRSVSLLVGW